MGGAVKSATKTVTKAFRAVKLGKFLSNINPFVALGVLAIGWLFLRARDPELPDYGTNNFYDCSYGYDTCIQRWFYAIFYNIIFLSWTLC